jgi:hypothetical protein
VPRDIIRLRCAIVSEDAMINSPTISGSGRLLRERSFALGRRRDLWLRPFGW